MGSGQSTRKLTINNSEELGVIHISNDVAQRLAQGVSNSTTNAEASSSSSTNVIAKPEKQWDSANPVEHRRSTYNIDQTPHPHPEYTISALKMQQLKDEELEKQNAYWQKRLQNLKENHAKIDRILDEEYKRAIDQVASAQGKKVDVSSVVPPCLENKDKVLHCYQEHPKEILKCSSLVEEFNNCVDGRRNGLIAARC